MERSSARPLSVLNSQSPSMITNSSVLDEPGGARSIYRVGLSAVVKFTEPGVRGSVNLLGAMAPKDQFMLPISSPESESSLAKLLISLQTNEERGASLV